MSDDASAKVNAIITMRDNTELFKNICFVKGENGAKIITIGEFFNGNVKTRTLYDSQMAIMTSRNGAPTSPKYDQVLGKNKMSDQTQDQMQSQNQVSMKKRFNPFSYVGGKSKKYRKTSKRLYKHTLKNYKKM